MQWSEQPNLQQVLMYRQGIIKTNNKLCKKE